MHVQSEPCTTAAFLGLAYSGAQLASDSLLTTGKEEGGLSLHIPGRAVSLSVHALAIVGLCFASIGSLLKTRIRRLKMFCWELIWVIVLGVNMAACLLRAAHASRRFFEEGEEDDRAVHVGKQEIACLIAPVVFVAACCFILPVRCVMLPPLSLLALLTSAGQAFLLRCHSCREVDTYQGTSVSEMTQSLLMVTLILTVMNRMARTVEAKVRRQWLNSSKQRVVAEAAVHKRLAKIALGRDLKVLKGVGCQAVVSLHEDLRVTRAGPTVMEFFGEQVNDTSFLDLVSSSCRHKVAKLLKRLDGSRLPRSVQVQIINKDQVREPCRLFFICHGRQGRHFLVGIRAGEAYMKKKRFSDLRIIVDDDPVEDVCDAGGSIIRNASSVVPVPTVVGRQRSSHRLGKQTKTKSSTDEDIAISVKAQTAPNLGFEPLSAADRDFSGFDSDDVSRGSSVHSQVFSATSEEEDGSSISNMYRGREAAVQTQANLGKHDVGLMTNDAWGGENFRCKCHALAQAPLNDYQRGQMMANTLPRLKRRRKSRKSHDGSSSSSVADMTSTLDIVQGTWTIHSQFIGIAQSFMHRLTFIGQRCIDSSGQCWKLHCDNGNMTLIKGRIWVRNNVLYREGKSGIVMTFQRSEDSEGAGPASSCSVSSGSASSEEDDESGCDSLAELEQLIGGGS